MSKLRVIRYLCGKSQEDVAFLTKISQTKISRFERGYAIPSVEEKEKIAKVLKTKTSQLFS